MEYIELALQDCQNGPDCIKAIQKAEQVFGDKLENGQAIDCAICGKLIEKRFRSAVRSFYDSKTLLIHPVHIECVQDHTPLDDLLKNTKHIDMSALDFLGLVGLVDTAHQFSKHIK